MTKCAPLRRNRCKAWPRGISTRAGASRESCAGWGSRFNWLAMRRAVSRRSHPSEARDLLQDDNAPCRPSSVVHRPSSTAPPKMLRLDKIVLREISLPLKEPFRISSGVETVRRILLLELFDH